MNKDDFSFLGSLDIETIEALYRDYQKDPGSVDESWRQFFRGFEFAKHDFSEQVVSETVDKEFKVIKEYKAIKDFRAIKVTKVIRD